MKQDHPTYNDYEIGDVTPEKCEFCGSLMAFLYDHNNGYGLWCIASPTLDHARMLTPDEIEG